MDISVLIVYYSDLVLLQKCVNSISQFMSMLTKEIIIVNNSGNTLELNPGVLNSEKTDILFTNTGGNIGFSKANNLASLGSNSEFLLILNPDTELIEDCASPIIEFMRLNPDAGICAPMLLNSDLSYQNSSGLTLNLFYEFLEAFMLIRAYRKIQSVFLIKKAGTNLPVRTGWVSGAFMVIRKSCFDNIKGFDEDFFMNYEDIDLCCRLKESGFGIYYFPYLKCIHHGMKSQEKDFESYVLRRYESKLVYMKKHYNIFLQKLIWLVHISGLMLRIVLLQLNQTSCEKIQRLSGYKKSMAMMFGLRRISRNPN
jgi:N-acetylglucosaminyl-diphospho-decaprenol L-rhamnosyltransferase